MGDYDTILTKEFLLEHQEKSSRELEKYMRKEMDCPTIGYRTIQRYRKQYGLVPQMKVLDKRQPPEISDSDYKQYHDLVTKFDDATTFRQPSVRIVPANPKRYVGIVAIGDIHFGSDTTDEDRLQRETEMIEDCDDIILFQVGDLVNNEDSLPNRGKTRFPSKEYSLANQRMRAVSWFKRVGDKMGGFIIGNHDLRSIISEDLDLGNDVAQKITGAYLGYSGMAQIVFENAFETKQKVKCRDCRTNTIQEQELTVVADLTYNIYLSHAGEGGSKYNPTHPGINILLKHPHLDLDLVLFGHIHDMTAYQLLPSGDKHAHIVRAGGYKKMDEYGQSIEAVDRALSTPLIILNPAKKECICYPDLATGIKVLNLLNGELT